MKKTTFFKFSLLFITLVFYNVGVAQELWYGDPNKGVREVFKRLDTHGYSGSGDCGDANHEKPTATNPTDAQYGKIWKIHKPQGRKRAEFARTSYQPHEGQTLYYGWRWKITSPDNLNKGFAIWQWKTTPGKTDATTDHTNYPLNMSYKTGKVALHAFGPGYPDWTAGSSITNRKTTIWTKDVPKDQWVTFIIKIKISRDVDKGYIEFWFNGEKQTLKNSNFDEYKVTLSSDKKRAYHKTWDGYIDYPKWGSYGGNACKFDISTYYDEMRIGTTYASVASELNLANSTYKTNDVSVYPNPVDNDLFIKTKKGTTAKLNIYDVKGRLMLSKNLRANKKPGNQLNVSALAKGVYFLKMNTDGKTKMSKFIKN